MNGLDEFAGEFGVSVEELTIWIERRWIRPARSGEKILFDDADRARVKMVIEFHHDLAIDDEMMPVVLGLIDRLHASYAQHRALLEALADLPQPHKASMLKRVKRVFDV